MVAAAGNLGKAATGGSSTAAITAPGNAPWVLTVGASSHEGTIAVDDELRAVQLARADGDRLRREAGPRRAGHGTCLAGDPTSTFYVDEVLSARPGRALGYKPYPALTGTSMARRSSGTVALMLQANPTLTPNAVKAILQYTSQPLATTS